jgi:hypothetical protein
MLRDARAVSMPSVRDSNGTRAKLDDILKRREFRSPREPSESNAFWDRLVDRLWMWLGKILIRASGHPGAFNFLLWGIVVVLGVIFLLWLLYTCTHLSYTRLPTPTRRQGSIATWMEWMQQARAAAARGEHREAIRMIYAAAVCRLGEKGVWQVDPSRTHREYVRLLPADSAHRPPLMGIATCFEQVWYGHAQASAHDYEAALTELESLE